MKLYKGGFIQDDGTYTWVMALLGLVILLVAVGVASAQEPQNVHVGSVSVTLPFDAQKADAWTQTMPLRIEHTTRWHSNSIIGTVTVSYVEFQESRLAHRRLVEFLHTFMENYGNIDHLVSIEDGDRKGMNIKAMVFHDRSMVRYTYVETRVFADNNRLYQVTVETEVTPQQALKTTALDALFSSMKVK